jgi:hypothetical protein
MGQLNSIQKALYRDFHEYWLERCDETISWEIDNNITQAKKCQKKLPKRRETAAPTERRTSIQKSKRIQTYYKEKPTKTITLKAINFVLRRPSEHPHNKFICDCSKKTVSKKIKTAKRALPTAETKEERKRAISLKKGLPELPQPDHITFECSDHETTPPRKRPRRKPRTTKV